jgi:thioredoxin reductase (NADPH)
VEQRHPYKTVHLADGSELRCYAVLFAAGMEVRELDVPGLSGLVGAGVYYGAAMTEAAAYRGSDVLVVGGANSAGQGALFFSRYARKVTILVRGPGLGAMSRYLVDRIEDTQNIEVAPHSVLTAVHGTDRLEAVTVCDGTSGLERTMRASAAFVFIGTAPRTALLTDFVDLDPEGFVLTGRDAARDGRMPAGWEEERPPFPYETSVPGVFAAGDARFGSGKRVAAAVGEGSAAIAMVHRYLETV